MDNDKFRSTLPGVPPPAPMNGDAAKSGAGLSSPGMSGAGLNEDRDDSNQIISRAGDLASKTFEQAKSLSSSARERLVSEADDKKGKLARKLEEMAQNVETGAMPAVGSEVDELQRKLTGGAAKVMRSVSRKLEEQTTEELISSAGKMIRERPGLFLAGCLAIGFLGGRMLRR